MAVPAAGRLSLTGWNRMRFPSDYASLGRTDGSEAPVGPITGLAALLCLHSIPSVERPIHCLLPLLFLAHFLGFFVVNGRIFLWRPDSFRDLNGSGLIGRQSGLRR